MDALYREAKSRVGQEWLLPLVFDCANPSPALGVSNQERKSFSQRGEANLTMALGLIHHLRISAGIPLQRIAAFLAQFSRSVLIEFVPTSDPMATALLSGRDYFDDYSADGLMNAFSTYFTLSWVHAIEDSKRSLFLFERKQ